jgi:hypothetical protein
MVITVYLTLMLSEYLVRTERQHAKTAGRKNVGTRGMDTQQYTSFGNQSLQFSSY